MTARSYAEVLQFYAEQIHALDDGRVDDWAATFAQDAVFVQQAVPGRRFAQNATAERTGRTAIADALRGAIRKRADTRVTRRYWIDVVVATPADGGLRTRFYALNVETPEGGPTTVHNSTVGEDLLTEQEGRLQIRRRTIVHDAAASRGA
ncbi:nuclear transport factor 2 family protein [Amycolatopsis sp. lyj-23]|uniref:nuclear transport factor 2 family protein n=1 Tax=Amycolatopsis sp. lyj-23 TaxID=2789283 RepID=UPI00397C1A29